MNNEIHDGSAPARVRANPNSDDAAGRATVLVVNASPAQRALMSAQLAVWGVTAVGAERADQALAAARAARRPFAAAILETTSADPDGATLRRALRAEPATAQTPQVLIGDDGAAAGRRDPALKFLDRPVRRQTLYDCLDSLRALDAAAADAATTIEPTTVEPSADKHILVVDDHPFNRELTGDMLGLLGYRASTAEHGREAVDMIRQHRYDLVLMDCMMPVMDGYEAARTIRRLGDAGATLPVVALTANALDGERERCLSAGMDDYLAKPVKIAVLRDTLNRWLDQMTGAVRV